MALSCFYNLCEESVLYIIRLKSNPQFTKISGTMKTYIKEAKSGFYFDRLNSHAKLMLTRLALT